MRGLFFFLQGGVRMELCASREYVLAAMDRKQEIQKLFLINLAAEVFAVLLFVTRLYSR